MEELAAPDRNQSDNGSEFISRVLEKRAYENGIEVRPHGLLGDLTQRQFVDNFAKRIQGQQDFILDGTSS